MDVEIRGTVLYPMMPNDRTLMMNIRALDKTSVIHNRIISTAKPGVKAATLLGCDSTTEVIDICRLSQKNNSVIQYVEVADSNGRLYCVDGVVGSSCWVKIVSLAKDCQSPNVILMTTDRGVILKTMRVITPGEPLLMWFTEHILAMMNIPCLRPINFHGHRYICNVCHATFEHPNPLKIHIALKCNQLDTNYLWTTLAKEFTSMPHPNNFLNFFSQTLPPPYHYELTRFHHHHQQQQQEQEQQQQQQHQQDHLPRIASPIAIINASKPKATVNNRISSSPLEPSPSSTSGLSSASSTQISLASSSTNITAIRTPHIARSSAFQPYSMKPKADTTRREAISACNVYDVPTTEMPTVRIEEQAAQLESLVSNLGKSKRGHYCIYCGKIYSRKYGLKIHIRTHTGYKPLKCRFCARPFGDPSNLNKHVRLHRGDTPYRCHLCDKILVRRRDLDRHIKSRHEQNGDHISESSSDRDA